MRSNVKFWVGVAWAIPLSAPLWAVIIWLAYKIFH